MASGKAEVTVGLSEEAAAQFEKFIDTLVETVAKADEWYRDQQNLRELIREEVRAAVKEEVDRAFSERDGSGLEPLI